MLNPSAERVGEALVVSIAELHDRISVISDTPAKMNFILTDGRLMFACRFNNPLFTLVRHGVHDCDICGIPHIQHEQGNEYRATLFASTPITQEPWKELPNYTLTSVDNDDALSLRTTDIMNRAAI